MNVELTERERQIIMSSLFTKAVSIRSSIVILKELKCNELDDDIAEYQKDIDAIISLRKKLTKPEKQQ